MTTTALTLKKTGRPIKMPPRNAAERIIDLSAQGYTKKGIAYRLRTSPDTLNRWLSERPDLQTALDEGREREHKELFTALYEKAKNGETVAALFLLKCRHGYKEGDQSDQANRVSINFNLPGAMKLEDFMTIQHEPNDRA